MKAIIFLLCFLYSCMLSADQSSPTRSEVISFISEKMERYGYAKYGNSSAQTKIELSCNPSSGNCKLTKYKIEYEEKSSVVQEFNLKDLDTNNFYASRSLGLLCLEEKEECVTVSSTEGEFYNYNDGVYFMMKFKGQALKVKKAFSYLVKTYKKKIELF